MSLKILCAGCSPQEREAVEAEVAAGLGARARDAPWTVSLVKIGNRWSVTLEGPERGTRGATFMAPDGRIRESIAEALRKGPTAPAAPASPGNGRSARAAGPTGAVTAGEKRDRHDCSKCQKPYAIVYEAEAGESTENVPVACPRCWQIDHVPVAQSTALSRDYRVEKIGN